MIQRKKSIGSMDFDNPKVYGDTSIFDGLVESMVDVDRQQLCDILEHGEGWRRVMGVVPRSRQDRTNKYSADQVWKLHLDCHSDIGDVGKCSSSKPERLNLQTSSACDYDNLDSKTKTKIMKRAMVPEAKNDVMIRWRHWLVTQAQVSQAWNFFCTSEFISLCHLLL